MSDQGPRIYEILSKLNMKYLNNPSRNWGGNIKTHFNDVDIQLENRHMKSCSTSLAITEIK
jgi:hypothetical protein